MPWVGSLMEENSCVFSEISGVVSLIHVVCQKSNPVTL
jgi:hypothetical protein